MKWGSKSCIILLCGPRTWAADGNAGGEASTNALALNGFSPFSSLPSHCPWNLLNWPNTKTNVFYRDALRHERAGEWGICLWLLDNMLSTFRVRTRPSVNPAQSVQNTDGHRLITGGGLLLQITLCPTGDQTQSHRFHPVSSHSSMWVCTSSGTRTTEMTLYRPLFSASFLVSACSRLFMPSLKRLHLSAV